METAGDGRGPVVSDRSGQSILSKAISTFGIFGISTLFVTILLTVADVLWRRTVGGAFIDIYDINRLALVAAASLSIPYGVVHGTHIIVDLVSQYFPKRLSERLDIAIYLVTAALIGLLSWLAFDAAWQNYVMNDTTQNLALPLVWYWALFLLGMALTILACLMRAYEIASSRAKARA